MTDKRKVWFVTGASSGLGYAAVVHLLEQGDKVVATLRKPGDISHLAAEYPTEQLLVVKLDVTLPADITAAFAAAIEAFGRIDVVYNNAGYGAGTPDEMARGMFEVNFWGAANVAREAVRVFRDVNRPVGGRLLQVSSVSGAQGLAALGYYSASKHALEGLSEALSKELHPSWNIKINILEIGGVKTRALTKQVMPVAPAHPAYTTHDSVPAFVRGYLTNPECMNDMGDANKFAREIRKIALDDSVGLRVPLGLDALAAVGSQLAEVKKDVEEAGKWSVDLK